MRVSLRSPLAGITWAAACLFVFRPTAGQDENEFDLIRLPYNHPGLVVDLGVGLWAWPLPMDWDQDGDMDLVVSCPDKPFNGTYFFENPGGKLPVFKPPVRLGAALPNVQISFVNGQPRVMTPGVEYTDFLGRDFSSKYRIYEGRINVGNGRIRANQWKRVDFDGDGVLDLSVGIGYWGDYGWDEAFNERGEWTRGPLHGYVFVIRNRGSNDQPQFDAPFQVTGGGEPIDVFGMPSPSFADFDNDGDLDLLCGEFRDGFTYFENRGSRTGPKYASGRPLMRGDRRLTMDLCMITPTAVDWDGDGDQDLVCGDEDGRVALIENTGNVDDGMPVFEAPVYFRQQAQYVKFGALATPVGFDWDGDGDEDILVGNTAGYIGFIENLGPAPGQITPRWAAPIRLKADGETIRIQAGPNGSIQGPCEAKWGYTTFSVADWDGDSLPDLVVNSIWGKIVWYRNQGSRAEPRLAAARPIEVEWPGAAPKPAWNWWAPQGRELVTQWRTTPVVADWDEDGWNDLVMLDHEGYLAFFQRKMRGNQLVLLPGRRLFEDSSGPLRLNCKNAGGSGRRKLSAIDWDGDGRRDLLINSENANWLRNVSDDGPPWILIDMGPVAKRRLAGHTSSPTTVQWDGDPERELLIGAEDGHFYYMPDRPALPKLVTRRHGDFTITGRGFELAKLENGGRAFSNRQYVWFDIPDEFDGCTYTRIAGGEPAIIQVTCDREATIFMATSAGQRDLTDQGWQVSQGQLFGYTDGGRTRMQIYSRKIKANRSFAIRQSGWTGCFLLLVD